MLSPPWKKRCTKKVFGPGRLELLVTLRLMPVMAEAMAITTMTPMATPRMVSAGAHLVGAERVERDADALDGAAERLGHGVSRAHSARSATMGSSSAARVAG